MCLLTLKLVNYCKVARFVLEYLLELCHILVLYEINV